MIMIMIIKKKKKKTVPILTTLSPGTFESIFISLTSLMSLCESDKCSSVDGLFALAFYRNSCILTNYTFSIPIH